MARNGRSRPLVDGPAVTVRDAVFSYGSSTALAKSTVEIPSGSITALIGPNGAGKSTLLDGIAGLMRPVTGEVIIGSRNGREHRISYVLQETKVNPSLPVTAREVVGMGRYAGGGILRRLNRTDRRVVDQVMDRTDITHLSRRHLSRLSGGERHRVLLAQGLAQDHDILLLDEPSTGLDVISQQAVRDTIRAENAHGCTVILTTHDLTEAQEADFVVLLAGRVVEAGAPEKVLEASNLVAAYGVGLSQVDGARTILMDHLVDIEDAHRHEGLTCR